MRARSFQRVSTTHALAVAAAAAWASPAAAQDLSVSVPSGPVEPGREVAFMVQVAPGATIDGVLLDPLPLGGRDTFVHRSRRGAGPAPTRRRATSRSRWTSHAAPGLRSLPLTVTELTTVTGVAIVAELLQEGANGQWLWSGPGTTEVGSTWR
jgi:hypothetical protein